MISPDSIEATEYSEGSGSSMPEDSKLPVEGMSWVGPPPPPTIQYLLVNVPEDEDGK